MCPSAHTHHHTFLNPPTPNPKTQTHQAFRPGIVDLPTGASEAPLASINVQGFGHFAQDLMLLGQAGGQLDDLEFGFGAGGGGMGRTSLDVLPVADQWVAAASHTIARCVAWGFDFWVRLFCVCVPRVFGCSIPQQPTNHTRRERITMEEAEQAMVGLDQSFDPNAELEDWGPFQPGLGEETRSLSGMYDEQDMDGAFGCWVVSGCRVDMCVCM